VDSQPRTFRLEERGPRGVVVEDLDAFYFATPHHSWERGTNENTNGLIRQYLPKRSSMARIEQADLDAIAYKLNTRPRKRLGFRTPEECYVQTG
jgi:IS30 family transposase